MSRTIRRWATGLGAIALLSSAALAGGPAAAAPSRFSVVASATAGEVTYTLQDFLVVSSLGGGAPTAQVTLDSTRGSYGFASAPYPGETVAGAPATLRGMGAPLPDVPTYVASRDPSVPKQDFNKPGIALSSQSTDTSGKASAKNGIDDQVPGGATGLATALAKTADSATTGSAEVDVQAFDLAGVLNVGRVHATAEVTADSAGVVKTSTDFSADLTVAGQQVGVTPKGLVTAGTTTPLPASSPLTAALKSAGITVEYVEATKTKTGVVSAGLRITTTHVPPSQLPALGGVPIKGEYLFGQAAASVRTGQDASTGGFVVGGGTTTGTGTGVASAPVGRSGNAGGGIGTATTPGGAAAAPDLPAAAAPGAEAPQTAGAPAQATNRLAPSALSLAGGAGAVGFYLVLVLGAGAALFGATLLRLLGVRNLWT